MAKYKVGDRVKYKGYHPKIRGKSGTVSFVGIPGDDPTYLTVDMDNGEEWGAPEKDWSFMNSCARNAIKVGDKVEVHTTSGGEINAPRKIKGTVTKLDNGYGKVVVGYRDPWGYAQEVFCNPSEIVKVFSNSCPCRSTNAVVAKALNACGTARNARTDWEQEIFALTERIKKLVQKSQRENGEDYPTTVFKDALKAMRGY